MEYTKKYGPMYRLWIGKSLVVSLSNVDHLEVPTYLILIDGILKLV